MAAPWIAGPMSHREISMTSSQLASPSGHEWTEQFVHQWLSAWNAHEVHDVLSLMTDDIAFDDSSKSQTMHGHAEVGEFVGWLWRAFPDFHVEAIGAPMTSTDGRRSAFWWRCTMTNAGPIDPPGIPATHRQVEYEGADFHEYRDGKVNRLRVLYDTAVVFGQLGLLPTG